MNKHIVFGILAHVDAGKTTLSEGCLFASGKIGKRGRVDKGDTCLDSHALERERGITVFSKQAVFSYGDKEYTLIDTPGHIDFSAEMERTLSVLDYAVLVISALEGVKPHTLTAWALLKKYKIPTFLFVNKMDASLKSEEEWLRELRSILGTNVVSLPKSLEADGTNEEELENIAVFDEDLMELFLEKGRLEKEGVQHLIKKSLIFPCFFGSALKYEGIEEFLLAFSGYSLPTEYGKNFQGRVFKITRDEKGNRLTHVKLLGGRLKKKDKIGEEKVNEIRLYSGERFEGREELRAGEVAALTGLNSVFAGDGIGSLSGEKIKEINDTALRYQLLLPSGTDSTSFFPKIRQLEEEIPELKLSFNEKEKAILLSLRGEVQKEILIRLVKERFGIEIGFGEGFVVYKETIKEEVYGYGHFEPLKHYAEVHLRLLPAKRDSGISVYSELSEEALEQGFQKQILAVLTEEVHKGVLTGSEFTDVEICLVNGRGHQKHTEGGDFREAALRALRNALMRGENLLLEPIYQFRLELPEIYLGRAMNDFSSRKAEFSAPLIEEGRAILSGKIAASLLGTYELTLRSYTKGEGSLTLNFSGYEDCHNSEEVIKEKAYYPEEDMENTADSVFCSHGAGFIVPWYEVETYLHLPRKEERFVEEKEDEEVAFLRYSRERESQTGKNREEDFIAHEEIDKILGQAVNSNKKRENESHRNRLKKKKTSLEEVSGQRTYRPKPSGEVFLLVDGYNIIFAWDELRELAKLNIDSARDRLIRILADYQGFKGHHLILVFDAYRVEGGREKQLKQDGLDIIYTKEAETADQYIAKTSKKLTKEGQVLVATSDSLVQMIIFGSGAIRLSAQDLLYEVNFVKEKIREKIE